MKCFLKVLLVLLIVGAGVAWIFFNGDFDDWFGTKSTLSLQGKKVLVVCYSKTGNTLAVAKRLREATGADFFEIEPVTPYPEDYRATVAQAKKELDAQFRPPLKAKVANLAAYDVVFLGSPVWYGTVACPVFTFLEENDLSGKTVVPFVTHGGGGKSRSFEEVRRLCPKSTVVKGKAFFDKALKVTDYRLDSWVKELSSTK